MPPSSLLIEAFSGISGNMFIGAGIALGFPIEKLKENLAKVHLHPTPQLILKRVVKRGIESNYFNVLGEGLPAPEEEPPHQHSNHAEHTDSHEHSHNHHHHHHDRSAEEIINLLKRSSLSECVKQDACGIFALIAKAEAEIHGKNVEDVHFHEVGAIDSIVDVIGAALVIEHFKPQKIYSKPLNTGGGFILCDHGKYPVPAPATALLLKDVPTYSDGNFEMTTPTGAAIAKYYTHSFSPPPLICKAIGYGAGTKEGDKTPNVLRLSLVNAHEAGDYSDGEITEELLLLETAIDDMNPQEYELLMERCFNAGALDVNITPVQMKKNRIGHHFSVLCTPKQSKKLRDIIYLNSTTIGMKEIPCTRYSLPRKEEMKETDYGFMRYKTVTLPDGSRRSKPEYDDCLRIAKEKNLPLQKLFDKE